MILDFNFVSKIKLLLHTGIDKNYKDKDGKSVLELFKEKYKLYCKPPQKLDYLKRNNSDKINQEHLCEKVSLVRNRL